MATPQAMVSAPARLAAPDAGLPSAGAPDRWWTLWGDPELDAMVEKALAANADIRVAQAHVRAARALVSVSEAALYPSIAANGAAWGTVADTGADGALGSLLAPVSEGATGGGYLVGLGAQWEPDVFGAATPIPKRPRPLPTARNGWRKASR
jgi:outer membrane protein TolC